MEFNSGFKGLKGDGKTTNVWNAVVAGIQFQRKNDGGLINFLVVWSVLQKFDIG